jgi:hypothetical protein
MHQPPPAPPLPVPPGLRFRSLLRPELDQLVEWAAGEGWNPGLDDAEVFWATDPDGFIAAELDGEFVGGGSVVSYGGEYGFMGFFIVRPGLRQQGLGAPLWFHRRDVLRGRLHPGAAIEMDGVFTMQPFYARGGFEFQHRDLRFEGRAQAVRPAGGPLAGELRPVAELPFEEVEGFDREHFPAPRPAFLEMWIRRPGGHALGFVGPDGLMGLGVSRPCRRGHKIGPLFARTPAVADHLFSALCERIEGEDVQIDVPEPNAAAVSLARAHGMREVFGCARMTLGSPPVLPLQQIFGVTSFELG